MSDGNQELFWVFYFGTWPDALCRSCVWPPVWSDLCSLTRHPVIKYSSHVFSPEQSGECCPEEPWSVLALGGIKAAELKLNAVSFFPSGWRNAFFFSSLIVFLQFYYKTGGFSNAELITQTSSHFNRWEWNDSVTAEVTATFCQILFLVFPLVSWNFVEMKMDFEIRPSSLRTKWKMCAFFFLPNKRVVRWEMNRDDRRSLI